MAEVIVEPEAEAELLAAAAWYEERREGLARELLEEVTRTIAAIRTMPAQYPRLAGFMLDLVVKRALLHRFPYALVFVETTERVHIIAAAHVHRDTSYWLHRLRDLNM